MICIIKKYSEKHTTGTICDKYKEKDSRIIVVHKENQGLSIARNTALDIANGEYYLFVDSDDIVNPDYVRALLSAVLENNCRLGQCSFRYFTKTVNNNVKLDENYNITVESGRDLCRKIYNRDGVTSTVVWSKIYHRSIWEKKRFPEWRIHEDLATTFEILYPEDRVAVVGYELYYYRRTANSIMHTVFGKARIKYFDALELHLDYYLSKNDSELVRECIKNYLYMGVLYTHIFYIKKVKNQKKLIDGLHGRMKKMIIFCDNNNIKVDYIYRMYLLAPVFISNLCEVLKRLKGKKV